MIGFRGRFEEAIEKLHGVQGLTRSSLGVRGKILLFQFTSSDYFLFGIKGYSLYLVFGIVAATETLVGLYLQLGQVGESLNYYFFSLD